MPVTRNRSIARIDNNCHLISFWQAKFLEFCCSETFSTKPPIPKPLKDKSERSRVCQVIFREFGGQKYLGYRRR
ncbi:MAG TPA: hypothetical protein VFF13_03315, partial [archaeon]|nr:hypothetical protein [archaeon]